MAQWFEDVFGFKEEGTYEEIHSKFQVKYELPHENSDSYDPPSSPSSPSSSSSSSTRRFDEMDATLIALPSNKSFFVGRFECPTVAQLSERLKQLTTVNANEAVTDTDMADASASALTDSGGKCADGNRTAGAEKNEISFSNIQGDVRVLHQDVSNANAVFQVASQFNCLEMVGPNVTPDKGITRYFFDRTQGPACALSCPAGTLYRNYFAANRNIKDKHKKGQGLVPGNQIDTLADVGQLVGNDREKYWRMKNGYCMPTDKGSIEQLSKKIASDNTLSEGIRQRIRAGVHWSTEVWSPEAKSAAAQVPTTTADNATGGEQRQQHGEKQEGQAHMQTQEQTQKNKQMRVCQVYSSALPVAYAYPTPPKDWEHFAKAVLTGAMDASLLVGAILSAKRRGERVKVYLTSLGGGAFGNDMSWIAEALERSLERYKSAPLDVYLVHYGPAVPSSVKGLEQLFKKDSVSA